MVSSSLNMSIFDAARNGNTEQIKQLNENGTYIDLQDEEEGYTSLTMATCHGRDECVRFLLEMGLRRITETNLGTQL